MLVVSALPTTVRICPGRPWERSAMTSPGVFLSTLVTARCPWTKIPEVGRMRKAWTPSSTAFSSRWIFTGKGWTYGVLDNQIWLYAGHEDRPGISSAFVQPFLTCTTKKHTTFGVNTESSYDWVDHQWTVPIN